MKTIIRTLWNSLLVVFLGTLLAGQAHGQIFVTNNFSGTIGKYDYNTGGTVNASLVSGLSAPRGTALSGANLYVANNSSGTIGEYNATTGATVNATLVSGLSAPYGIAVSGGYLYVANDGNGTIGKYNASTGATVKASLVSGLSGPVAVAVSGTNLYVSNLNNGTIGEYNATTGATVNASLVSGLISPKGIVVAGVNLFVVTGSNTVGEYNATTGAPVNAALVSGLDNPVGIAVVATPQEFSLRTVPLQSNAWGSVTVNQALNKIYTSGNPSSNTNIEVTVIDGNTFAIKDVGYGAGVSVDNKTNNYWAATIYGNVTYPAGVIVRDGTTDDVVATVNLGYCPIETTYDFFKSRVWVGAQCGGGNDPVFAINANAPFNVIAGTPKGSNGIMGSIGANGVNGRLYIYDPTPTPLSERVNPTTFAVTQEAFGQVMTINGLTNKLYAISGNTLQIINGAVDPEVVLANIPLSYTPSSMGINTALNRLYITNPAANNIEIRDPSTGALINTFALSAFGVTPNGAMAVDSTRSRIYVIDQSSSPPRLLVIEDIVIATTKGYTAQCISPIGR